VGNLPSLYKVSVHSLQTSEIEFVELGGIDFHIIAKPSATLAEQGVKPGTLICSAYVLNEDGHYENARNSMDQLSYSFSDVTGECVWILVRNKFGTDDVGQRTAFEQDLTASEVLAQLMEYRIVEFQPGYPSLSELNGVVTTVKTEEASGILYGWRFISIFQAQTEGEHDFEGETPHLGGSDELFAVTSHRGPRAWSLLGKAAKTGKPYIAFIDPRVGINRSFIRPPGGHVYAIIDVFYRDGCRMVMIRNPGGREGRNDYGGLFQLTYKDFLAFYAGCLYVNKYKPDWHRFLEDCDFVSGESRSHFKITVHEQTNVMFGMFGDDYRKFIESPGEPPLLGGTLLHATTGTVVAEISEKLGEPVFYEDLENDSELSLDPGEYLFKPDVTNPRGEINFGLFSNLPVTVEKVRE